MSYVTAGNDVAGQPVHLYYEDSGEGAPAVLIHGWPLNHAMWEYQSLYLARHGVRAISYDRRGFGHSSKPWDGYDYDTFADDLKAVLDTLNLEGVTLIGFSMGGGEVARYMSRHGGARVAKVAFLAAVPPFLLKTEDNPTGVDRSVFQGIIAGIEKDHPKFMAAFGKRFYGVREGKKNRVGRDALQHNFLLAMQASLKATVDCVTAFGETDFRKDLEAIHVPALIIHGDNDQTVPLEASGAETAKRLPHAKYLIYEGAPHGLTLTDKDRLNEDLREFIVAP